MWAETYGEGVFGENSFGEGGSGNSTDNNDEIDKAPIDCDEIAPKSAPVLYKAEVQKDNAILLKFMGADDPVQRYELKFGRASDKYIWGAITIGDLNVRSYLVKSLDAGTTYYFRVRAANECAVGPWSQEISAKAGHVTFSTETQDMSARFDLQNDANTALESQTQTPGNKEQDSSQLKKTYSTLIVTLVDSKGKAVANTKVEFGNENGFTKQVSSNEGKVHFKDIAEGKYTIIIVNDDFKGDHEISINGEPKEYHLEITLASNNFKDFLASLVIKISVGLIIIAGLGTIAKLGLFKGIKYR